MSDTDKAAPPAEPLPLDRAVDWHLDGKPITYRDCIRNQCGPVALSYAERIQELALAAAPPAAQAEPDIADIVAGALQTSRANAYELMRAALTLSNEPSAFLVEPTPEAHPALMVDVVRFHPGYRPDWTVTPLYAAPPAAQAGDGLPPTVLKAARALLDALDFSCGPHPVWDAERDALRAAIASRGAQAGDGREAWVPVTERLPEPGRPVLAMGGGLFAGTQLVVRLILDGGDAKAWMLDAGSELIEVDPPTHWMPLPTTPGEQG